MIQKSITKETVISALENHGVGFGVADIVLG